MKGRTSGIAFRQAPTPQPLLRVSDPAADVPRLIKAIEAIQHARGCGCYLFISPTQMAYVVAEDRAWMQQCLRDLHKHAWFPWLVAYYTLRRPTDPRIPVLRPTVDGLIEDVVCHLASVDALPSSALMRP